MKKVFVLSMALLLCVMSVLVGCSSSGGDNSELIAYAEKQQDAADSMSMTGFEVECSAEGDSLVYTYKYGSDLLTEELAQTTLDALGSSSDALLEAVQKEVPSCASLVFKIAGSDGKILAEEEFK